jgi:hypothetical protein
MNLIWWRLSIAGDANIYQPLVDKDWQALLIRISSDGCVLDVAESTGTQDLTYGLSAPCAILDRDARAGSFCAVFRNRNRSLQ